MSGADDAAAAAAAERHFVETLGGLPDAVRVMLEHAPAAAAGYLDLRAYVHRGPEEGGLDPVARELLFVALDVVEDHGEAAKAHAEQALKAGATVAQIAQALVIAMMVSGISTWSKTGHAVVAHAARVAARGEEGR